MDSLEKSVFTDTREAVEFPQVQMPHAQESILTLTESLELSIKSPVPRTAHWFLRKLPYMRKAHAYKENMIATELDKAKKRFSEGSLEKQVTRCAMDDVLRRELAAAKKEDREPNYKTRAIFDEVSLALSTGAQTNANSSLASCSLPMTQHPQRLLGASR